MRVSREGHDGRENRAKSALALSTRPGVKQRGARSAVTTQKVNSLRRGKQLSRPSSDISLNTSRPIVTSLDKERLRDKKRIRPAIQGRYDLVNKPLVLLGLALTPRWRVKRDQLIEGKAGL